MGGVNFHFRARLIFFDNSVCRSARLSNRFPADLGALYWRQVEEDPDSDETADMAWLLYDSALTASGFQVDDTEAFSSRVHRAMAKTLNLSSMELLEEADIPDEVSAVGASLYFSWISIRSLIFGSRRGNGGFSRCLM